MSAVSEVKTLTSIKDNMTVGFKVIQKEQLRIKKEIQETREVLKDTFGKKWSIKLQSIELLRYMREIAKEIGLLRKQLARMLQGFGGKKASAEVGASLIVKSAVVERKQQEGGSPGKGLVYVNEWEFGKFKGEDNWLSDSDKSFITFVDKAATGAVGVALDSLTKAASSTAVSLVPLAPAIGAAVAGLAQIYINHENELESRGSIMETQALDMETVFKSINPTMDIEKTRKSSADYLTSLRDNSAQTGFNQNDVMIAGTMAVSYANGDTGKAMEQVRFAENIAALNPGATATQVIKDLENAKKGGLESVQKYLPGVNLGAFKPEEFEGKVVPMLKEVYKDGVEKWLETTEGKVALNEAIRQKLEMKDAIKKNEVKKNAETYQNYLLTRELVEDTKNPDQSYFKQSGGITGIGDIRDSKEYSIGDPIKISYSQSKQNGILNNNLSRNGNFVPPQMRVIAGSSQTAAATIASQNSQSSVTTVQSPNFTINFTGTNMSNKEIIDELAKSVKLALVNMCSKPNTWLGGMPA